MNLWLRAMQNLEKARPRIEKYRRTLCKSAEKELGSYKFMVARYANLGKKAAPDRKL